MSREQKVDGPRIDAPDLGVLEDGTLDVLEPGDDVEGLAFSGSRAETVSLRGGTVSNSTFTDCLVDELDLTSARVVDTRFRQVSVSVLKAARGGLRDVEFDGGRLGAVEAYDASWNSVHVRGCKVNYLNLRAAKLTDLLFTDCVIDELDLAQADIARMRLVGTRVGSLALRQAELRDLDLREAELEQVTGVAGLRGAVVSPLQLMELAPVLAAEIGLRVLD